MYYHSFMNLSLAHFMCSYVNIHKYVPVKVLQSQVAH